MPEAGIPLASDGSVSAIVPAFNEHIGIIPTVTGLVEIFQEMGIPYEILVIDDGSTDGTGDRAATLLEKNPRIRLIRHTRNRGLAASFLEGVQAASMQYCFKVHGDNNDPKESLVRILENRGKADLIIPYFSNIADRTIFRRITSTAYTGLVNFISGYRLRYYNGSVLFRTEDLRKFVCTTGSFAFQAEAVLFQLDRGSTFAEIPTRCDFQEAGSHAFRLQNIVGVGGFLMRALLRYRLRADKGPDGDCRTSCRCRKAPPRDPA